MKSYITIALLITFIKITPNHSSGYKKDVANSFFNHLYNLDFKSSKESITNHLSTTNDTIENNFFRVNYIWWEILTGKNDKATRKKLLKLASQSITKINRKKSITNEDKVLHTLFTAYKLRVHSLSGNYFSGLRSAINTKTHIKSILKYTNNEESIFIAGLYNSCYGYAINHKYYLYPVLAFFPNGNYKTGVKQLKKCTKSSNNIIKTESIYFLYKISSEFEGNISNSVKYLRILTQTYPNNIVFKIELLKHLNLKEDKRILVNNIKSTINSNNSLLNSQKNFLISLL